MSLRGDLVILGLCLLIGFAAYGLLNWLVW